MRTKLSKFLSILGPGLLYAGAAIGVSHLVQSTRAGASYGFLMAWAIVLIHIFKYPFFQIGPRYAAATGESLIEGYKRVGNWALSVFILFTFGTMFSIISAITVVTASISAYVFDIDVPVWQICVVIWLLGITLLASKNFKVLDKAMKVIIFTLAFCTILAVLSAVFADIPERQPPTIIWDAALVAMLIKLMGWMPAPLDLAVWNSLWSLEKQEKPGLISFKESLTDFNFGYWGTMILGIGFLAMGALLMHGTPLNLPAGGAEFAKALIDLYTLTLGGWMHWIVAIAALTTMVSTTLTVMDAIPRTLQRTVEVIQHKAPQQSRRWYWCWLLIMLGGSLLLLTQFTSSMTQMVDLATVLSFLTTPILAYINYRVFTSENIPKEFQLSKGMLLLSKAGIAFLTFFALAYLYTEFLWTS